MKIILTSLVFCFLKQDEVSNSKETAKLRMRLRGAQGKLDSLRVRYNEAMDEMDFMNRKFEAASVKLKGQLAAKGAEVLNLMKQLSSIKRQ